MLKAPAITADETSSRVDKKNHWILAKSATHKFPERLQIHEASVLRFSKDPYVLLTHNRAERDLRISKVKQKVSGCFRAEEYAQAYRRILSYLQEPWRTKVTILSLQFRWL
jgi:predicted metal-dependent hydrolase